MSSEPDRTRFRQLAKESFAQGDPTGWFERLYQEAEQGTAAIPWADLRPNPNLTSWWESRPGVELNHRSALVVGCGLGDDAEQLAQWGAQVTAFDIAPSAVAAARKRFPASRVNYQVADLLHPPENWTRHFDFIFEAYTLQALPPELLRDAMRGLDQMLSSSGALLIIARGRDASDDPGEAPWPLTADDLLEFERLGLLRLSSEDYMEGDIRRFRVLYRHL